MHKLIIFDCDGTLVDSQHTIVTAMHRAFDRVQMPRMDDHAVRSIVGLSVLEAIQDLVPNVEGAVQLQIADAFKQEFFLLRTQEASGPDPLYPGTREVLTALNERGFVLGVATGNSDRGLNRVIDEHALEGIFVTLQTADRHPSKPHPSMIEQAIAEAGAGPETTIMVGDTTFDMQMARSAQCMAVGVDWGYHSTEELRVSGAAHILSRFEDLLPIAAQLG